MLAEARQLGKRTFKRRQSNERAAPLMPLDPTLQLELVQRLPYRRPADAETLTEVGLRRKRCSGTEPLELDQFADTGCDLDIQRQLRPPIEGGIKRRTHHKLTGRPYDRASIPDQARNVKHGPVMGVQNPHRKPRDLCGRHLLLEVSL
jgi:hypothetical protein